MAKKKIEEPPVDPTGFILDSGFADFVLMHSVEIKYMCMVGYTFLHGTKLFKTFEKDDALSYKLVRMVMQCTGGGILIPIFLNAIPVPLAVDAYPIAIMFSFFLHAYFPILREVLALSPIFKASVVFLYETMRASVVMKLTYAAGNAIPPSEFSFAVFGPIMCGTIAGCGGAFLPFNKGLSPIQKSGMAPPMFSAFVGATFFHLFLNTSLSDGVENAKAKAHVILATWFILHGMHSNGLFKALVPTPAPVKKKVKKN